MSTSLVTGGGGFLGKAIVRRLLDRGDAVRSFSRGDYPELRDLGAEVVRGDVVDADQVADAVKDCDLVFHVAAKAGVGGRYQEYYAANVQGTENIINACRRHNVPRLVYTSSPSVVFDGKDMENVDESVPYPDHYHAHYPKTKALAEQKILEANSESLATTALRPHLIWGPGDNHLIPRLLQRARSGRLRRIGKANKLIDTVYIDNAATAHLLAADHLEPGSAVAGKAYFISQGEPLPIWDVVNRILAAADLPPVTKSVPFGVAYSAGWLMESIYGLLRLRAEPPMTRFVVREMATAHWFNINAARRDFGYDPTVTIDDGMKRLAEHFQENSRIRADG